MWINKKIVYVVWYWGCWATKARYDAITMLIGRYLLKDRLTNQLEITDKREKKQQCVDNCVTNNPSSANGYWGTCISWMMLRNCMHYHK